MLFFAMPDKALSADEFAAAATDTSELGNDFRREWSALLVAEALFKRLAPRLPLDTPVDAYYRMWMSAGAVAAADTRRALTARAEGGDDFATLALRRLDHADPKRGPSDWDKYVGVLINRAAEARESPMAQHGIGRRLAKLREDTYKRVRKGQAPESVFELAKPLPPFPEPEGALAYLWMLHDSTVGQHRAAQASIRAAEGLLGDGVIARPKVKGADRNAYMASYMRDYRAGKRRREGKAKNLPPFEQAVATLEQDYGTQVAPFNLPLGELLASVEKAYNVRLTYRIAPEGAPGREETDPLA